PDPNRNTDKDRNTDKNQKTDRKQKTDKKQKPDSKRASNKKQAASRAPKEKGVESRKLAVEVLLKVDREGAYSNIALKKALDASKLSSRDRAFVTCLVQGVTRNRDYLDHLIASVSDRSADKLAPVLLNTLRLGIFQLEFLKDLPPRAVVSTCTSVARNCGHDGLARYTTAALNRHLKKKGEQSENSPEAKFLAGAKEPPPETAEALALRYSMPGWIVERWLSFYGLEETRALLEHSQSEPAIAVRVNETAMTPEGLLDLFQRQGVKARRSKLVEAVLIIESGTGKHGGLDRLPGYEEGLFSVQDEAAALAALALAPAPGQVVVDLCAAPGGKTLHLSELMEGTGRIFAVDRNETRLELLKENRRRLGLSNIEIVCGDGLTFSLPERAHADRAHADQAPADQTPADKAPADQVPADKAPADQELPDKKLADKKLADRVLVDAPCSGTGVLNRRPDLRYRRRPEDIESLTDLQLGLLCNASRLLKPGGVLVYVTCSVEPEENQKVLEKFLQEDQDFRLDDLSPFLPAVLAEKQADALKSGQVQLLPSTMGLSGFYIARLVRS
ncbi:MAG: methyltransferase domain-containing protein, partial [Cyanobacteria bacterium HKST-UBA02]|nr:methyltransferase domain-containing protein [Cyanobacteria bacterium HKST-UBA02]